jgi:hypothetical protein
MQDGVLRRQQQVVDGFASMAAAQTAYGKEAAARWQALVQQSGELELRQRRYEALQVCSLG